VRLRFGLRLSLRALSRPPFPTDRLLSQGPPWKAGPCACPRRQHDIAETGPAAPLPRGPLQPGAWAAAVRRMISSKGVRGRKPVYRTSLAMRGRRRRKSSNPGA